MYEEAVRTVMTVRDFTQVFDSYAQFEESMIAAKMETSSELGREEEGTMWDSGLGLGGGEKVEFHPLWWNRQAKREAGWTLRSVYPGVATIVYRHGRRAGARYWVVSLAL